MNAISFNIRGRIYNWLEEILRERFNLELQIIEINDGISLLLKNADLSIKLPKMNTDFFNEKSTVTCGEWNTSKENWDSILDKPIPTPGMSKLPFPLIKHKKGMYIIKYDIMGLLYWTLSRQEEVTSVIVDSHNRFPASASHAYKHNYLERPIVDEWLHILGQVIKKQWPHVELKKHKFQLEFLMMLIFPANMVFLVEKSCSNLSHRILSDIMITEVFYSLLGFVLIHVLIFTQKTHLIHLIGLWITLRRTI